MSKWNVSDIEILQKAIEILQQKKNDLEERADTRNFDITFYEGDSGIVKWKCSDCRHYNTRNHFPRCNHFNKEIRYISVWTDNFPCDFDRLILNDNKYTAFTCRECKKGLPIDDLVWDYHGWLKGRICKKCYDKTNDKPNEASIEKRNY